MFYSNQLDQFSFGLGHNSSADDIRNLVEQLVLEDNGTSEEEQELIQELIRLYESMKERERNPIQNNNYQQYQMPLEEADYDSEINCPICLDNLLTQDVFFFQNCKHIFHRECLESFVINKIKEKTFPIRCPEPKCKKEILEDEIKDIIQNDIRYQDVYDDNSIRNFLDSNPEDYYHCPTPDCDFVCQNIGRRFNCPKCKKSYCVVCKTDWHRNMKCEEFQKLKKMQGSDYFNKFVEKMKFKKCPKCKTIIERSSGCNAMVCTQCNTSFCYACGRQGDGHKCNHT